MGVSPATPMSELMAAAQQHIQRRLKLTAKDRWLDLTATLRDARLRDGDVVDAVAQPGTLAATYKAFVCVHGGEVVTWGEAEECPAHSHS